MNKVIQGILLPVTFPSWMVPNSEHRFMNGLFGMSLAEAIAQAATRGIQPTTQPMPEVHEHAHSFSVVVDGMVIPWCVIVSEGSRVLH